MGNKCSTFLIENGLPVVQEIHIFNNTFYCQTLTSVVADEIGKREGERGKIGSIWH